VELVKFLEKDQELCIQIIEVPLKMTSYRTLSKKQKIKKVKIQVSMGETNFFLAPYPSPLV
jgi:hypothetical protein